MRAARLSPLFAAVFALACAPSPGGDAIPGKIAEPSSTPSRHEAAGDEGFLAPNAEDTDGTPMYVHFTADDMPLRVAVQMPKLAARYASLAQTRAAVVEAIQSWQTAIQPALPWFQLEIVDGETGANIVAEWRTRISGDAAGRGGIGWTVVDGKMRARGSLEYATKPCLDIRCQLELDQLKLLMIHEFGHTLGLRHCLSCDSAMSYNWETQKRVFITDLDVRTIVALYRMPNGTRADGNLARALRPALH
jgi:predicted Zn-dependent protease